MRINARITTLLLYCCVSSCRARQCKYHRRDGTWRVIIMPRRRVECILNRRRQNVSYYSNNEARGDIYVALVLSSLLYAFRRGTRSFIMMTVLSFLWPTCCVWRHSCVVLPRQHVFAPRLKYVHVFSTHAYSQSVSFTHGVFSRDPNAKPSDLRFYTLYTTPARLLSVAVEIQ